ncbi:hypothetical protein D3C72_1151140 [compost metagenome]
MVALSFRIRLTTSPFLLLVFALLIATIATCALILILPTPARIVLRLLATCILLILITLTILGFLLFFLLLLLNHFDDLVGQGNNLSGGFRIHGFTQQSVEPHNDTLREHSPDNGGCRIEVGLQDGLAHSLGLQPVEAKPCQDRGRGLVIRNMLIMACLRHITSHFVQGLRGTGEEIHHGPFDAAVLQDVGQLSMKAFTAMHAKIRKTDVGSLMSQIPPDGIHVRIIVRDIRYHDGFSVGVSGIVTDRHFDTELLSISSCHDRQGAIDGSFLGHIVSPGREGDSPSRRVAIPSG